MVQLVVSSPIDEVTLGYLKLTGRQSDRIALVEAYSKAEGLWRNAGDEPVFTDTLSLDMSTVQASLAGPKRPQDRVYFYRKYLKRLMRSHGINP